MEGDPALARDLAALIEREAAVVEVVVPHQGLVMCDVRETARNSRFYLGEALMTECRVRIGEVEGLGVVLGTNGALAHDLAVVDAAYALEEPLAIAPELDRRLACAQAALAERRAREAARIMASRVSFDTMGGQDMSVQAVVK